ncbi:glycosyl hydrolase family 18 protein [Anaerovorax odorimutans]|uniref:glycosyl hydrolase family 18 protein n=1 Tax=Anaerovorax odorimutans TaxID=109327 RepID=UPI00040E3300|nr:glycosyl hydrolase family 18 protein [Anaerovorax odorimutans]
MTWDKVQATQKRSIIVNGYAYPFISQDVLQKWLPDLTFVSTFSYGITPEGKLIPLQDESIIAPALENGVQPLMVLTSLNEEGTFSSELVNELLQNPEAEAVLIENILNNIKAKNMYGIDFDFEYVFPENRDQYVELVGKTARRLNPEGYIVSVALAPKTYTEQKGLLYEGHNYLGMGQVANLALLMTYEWGYAYGPLMVMIKHHKYR